MGAFAFVDERRPDADEKGNEHARDRKLDQCRGEGAATDNEISREIEENRQLRPGHDGQHHHGNADHQSKKGCYVHLLVSQEKP